MKTLKVLLKSFFLMILLSATVFGAVSTITINCTSNAVIEGNVTNTNVDCTLNMDNKPNARVDVNVTGIDDSALNGTDYTFTTQTFTYLNTGAHNAIRSFSFTISGDADYENNETFKIRVVNVGSNSDYSVANNDYPITIVNDDPVPPLVISIADTSSWEYNIGTEKIYFPITLAAPLASDVTVNYMFQNIDTNVSDTNMTDGGSYSFILSSGTLSGTYNIPLAGVIGDTIQENNETFLITLTSMSGMAGTISSTENNATCTILDDDGVNAPPPSGSTSNYNVVHPIFYNASPSSSHLPTQITKRVETYKVLSLDQITGALQDTNSSVYIELVDADSSADCATMTPINTKVKVLFTNQNYRDFDGDVITGNQLIPDYLTGKESDKEFYQKATRNVKFRMSYSTLNGDAIEIYEQSPPGSELYRATCKFNQAAKPISSKLNFLTF